MKYHATAIYLALIVALGICPSYAASTGDHPAYTGNPRVAVIMLAWKDTACPTGRQNVVTRVWNGPQSLRNYYTAMSRGVFNFALPPDTASNGIVTENTSDVYGPYVLSIEAGFDKDITFANVESYYGSPGSPYLSGTHSVARALASARDGFNANLFDYIMYVTPNGPSAGGTLAYAGINATYSHYYKFDQKSVLHEIGHNVGLAHSNDSIDTDNYESQDDPMGNQSTPHLDSVHTYNMGWYPDANFNVKSYGQYAVENLAQPDTDNVKVLRFDRSAHGAVTNPTYDLWIAYRVLGVGHDTGLHGKWDRVLNIHYCRVASKRPSDDKDYYYYNNNVSKFLTGGSYTDPDGLCEVRFLREENTGNASAVVQLIDPNGNQPPDIPDQSITVEIGTSNFSIEANDPENDALSYTIVEQPSQGNLSVSGDAFTLTSVETGDFTFTVRANDGKYDSRDVVIQLSVIGGIAPPTADAGPDQAIALSKGGGLLPWTPADLGTTAIAWYDADDAAKVTTNASGVVTQWLDKANGYDLSTAQTTAKYNTLTLNGKKVVDCRSGAKFENTAFQNCNAGVSIFAVSMIADVNLTPFGGIFDLEHDPSGTKKQLGIDTGSAPNCYTFTNGNFRTPKGNVTMNGGPYRNTTNIWSTTYTAGSAGSYLCINGVTNKTNTGTITLNSPVSFRVAAQRTNVLQCAMAEVIVTSDVSVETRQKIEGYLARKWGLTANLPTDHPYKSTAPTKDGGEALVATVNLDGTVFDADGDPLTTTWSVVSTNPSGLTVNFSDPSAVDTTATFTAAGTYTLRLTADDKRTTVSDDVVITVTGSSGATFANWVAAYNLGGLSGFGQDPDGDGLCNGLESYFGTDPGSSDSSGHLTAGEMNQSANTFTFSHPLNPNVPGDIVARYRWTSDLVNFHGDGVSDGLTTVHFSQGPPTAGRVTVTATITGTPPGRFFVNIEVTQP